MHRPFIAAIALSSALALPPAVASADAPEVAVATTAPGAVRLGLAAGGSRFGTAHQTFYQATAVPSIAVEIAPGIDLVGALPASGGVARNSSCCRYGLGNATAGLRYHRALGGRLLISLASSVSFATTGSADHDIRNGLYAATAQLTDDAGFYLPGTTTVRLGTVARYRTRRFEASARIGAHVWSTKTDSNRDTTLVVPIAAHFGWNATTSLQPVVGLRTLTKAGPDASVAAAIEGGLVYRRPTTTYKWFITLPIDSSSRDLGIISLSGALTWDI